MRTPPRAFLASAALLALLPACGMSRSSQQAGATPEVRSFGDPSQLQDETPPPGVTAAPGETSRSTRTGTTTTRTPTPAAGAKSSRTPAPVRPRDDGMTGANAKLYLQAAAPRMIVEMGAVAGKEPTASALDFVKSSLQRVLDKPDGIELRLTETFASQKDAYTGDDLQALEEKYRQTHSTQQVASLYLLFLDGEFKDAPALGVAYKASSIAIFTDQIAGNATFSGSLSRDRIERSTILHEVGHVLGLVNLGYTSPRDHADPEHPSHSKNRESVMYWAVEALNVSAIFRGGPPDEFDDDDLADLADLKANRL